MSDYKFQIASFAVIIILLIRYCRNRKLPLVSTRIFTAFMVMSVLNIVCDAITVYTINHIEAVSPFINRFAHQWFIGSLDAISASLYFYVLIITDSQRQLRYRSILTRAIPFFVSIVIVIFAPLYYYVSDAGSYSYGPMAWTVYVTVTIYVILIVLRLHKCYANIAKEKVVLIIWGISIWILIMLVQMFNPTILMSSTGVMLLVLLVYLSFENPRDYADEEVGTLNRMAFHKMIPEMIASNKKFYLVNFVVDDIQYIQNVMGYSEARNILVKLSEHIKKITYLRIFHSRGNTVSLIVTKESELDKLKIMSDSWKMEYKNERGINYIPKYHMDILECPTYAKTVDEVYNIMDYMIIEGSLRSKINIIDERIILDNNHFQAVQKLVETAVLEDGFEVFYQPIYSNDTHKFSSAEALVRLKDNKTLGFISPEIFIPIAEQKGLIKELGNIVFEKVCIFASTHDLKSLGVRYIEVNLSGVQGVDKNIVSTLNGYMNRYGIEPGFINLEITETASVEAGDSLLINMEKLRDIGCHFSMDDFGTGYSNLSQIAKVKFELIKLDKSLIWPCFEDNREDAVVILNNCINMIMQLGIKIVAEGVETKEQMEMLTKQGVTYLQGYYFSRPMCEEDYIKFICEKNL